MKLTKYLLLGAAVCGVASCAKDLTVTTERGNENSNGGDTYASMVLQLTGNVGAPSRVYSQADEAGTTKEQAVKDVNVLFSQAGINGGGYSKAFDLTTPLTDWTNWGNDTETFTDLSGWKGSNTLTYFLNPWKVYAGTQSVGVLINAAKSNAAAQSASAEAYKVDLTSQLQGYDILPLTSLADASVDPKDAVKILTADDGYLMTSKVEEYNVHADVKRKDVFSGVASNFTDADGNPAVNRFAMDIERVVAKGAVKITAGVATTENNPADFTVTQNQTFKVGTVGSLQNMAYAAINGGARTYVYATNAGERTMTMSSNDAAGHTSESETNYARYKGFKAWTEEALKNIQTKDLGKYETAEGKLARLSSTYKTVTGTAAGNTTVFNTLATEAEKLAWIRAEKGTGGVFASVADIKTNATGKLANTVETDDSYLTTDGRGVYFLENSALGEGFYNNANDETKMQYGWYRLPYAKIYGQYVPKTNAIYELKVMEQDEDLIAATRLMQWATTDLKAWYDALWTAVKTANPTTGNYSVTISDMTETIANTLGYGADLTDAAQIKDKNAVMTYALKKVLGTTTSNDQNNAFNNKLATVVAQSRDFAKVTERYATLSTLGKARVIKKWYNDNKAVFEALAAKGANDDTGNTLLIADAAGSNTASYTKTIDADLQPLDSKEYTVTTVASLFEADKSVTSTPAAIAAADLTTRGYERRYFVAPVSETTENYAGNGYKVGQTFVQTYPDGKLYTSKLAAALWAKGARTANGSLTLTQIEDQDFSNFKIETFTNGYCFYKALWNDTRSVVNQKNENIWYADARRNNFYDLQVSSFSKVGDGWDQSDPYDPFTPKADPNVLFPGDEDVPNLPTETDMPTSSNPEQMETWMTVVAKVRAWNRVLRDGINF